MQMVRLLSAAIISGVAVFTAYVAEGAPPFCEKQCDYGYKACLRIGEEPVKCREEYANCMQACRDHSELATDILR
ncbi:hypothetical protein BCL79_0413 [Stenotrophomonas rhizophila]|uniref:Uncharacterized protein n=1 Tax=Stenotrophomonas rhizophila TaxID=216778 RepID=A0A498CFS4_9GAMM|nr:hypothetical protein BCL79_0413 [Stenotrophomonas rhizophila]